MAIAIFSSAEFKYVFTSSIMNKVEIFLYN